MHLAYIDDSGDSRAMALAAIMVPSDSWLEVHDQLVEFRRRMAKDLQFRMREELKATEIISGGGEWRRRAINTRRRTRFGLYKAAMRELASMSDLISVMAVVIPDRNHPGVQLGPEMDAWSLLLERLERYSHYSGRECMLIPDAGNPRRLQAMTRRKRRFGFAPPAFGGPGRKVPFRRLVDDPVHRDSRQSYLVQWADLVAYAAFRRVLPRPDAPMDLWDIIGDARNEDANRIERERRGSDEPPGLVVWPQRRLP